MAPGRLAELVPASVCSYLRVEKVQISAKKMGDKPATDLGVGKLRLQCAAGPNVASTLYYSRLLRRLHTLHLFQVSSARVDSFVGNTQVGEARGNGPQSIIQGALMGNYVAWRYCQDWVRNWGKDILEWRKVGGTEGINQ